MVPETSRYLVAWRYHALLWIRWIRCLLRHACAQGFWLKFHFYCVKNKWIIPDILFFIIPQSILEFVSGWLNYSFSGLLWTTLLFYDSLLPLLFTLNYLLCLSRLQLLLRLQQFLKVFQQLLQRECFVFYIMEIMWLLWF
jgi:hypothetical protein